MLWKPGDDGEERTMGMGRLRGHPDCEFPGCFMKISHAAAGLNWRGMNARNVHLLLDDHAVGLGVSKGSIGCLALTSLPVKDLVSWLLILLIRSQQRCIRIKSFFGIDYHGQWLVINFDSSGAISSCIPVSCNNKSHFLHLVMHPIQRQHCLCIC